MISHGKGIEETGKREERIYTLPCSSLDVKISPNLEDFSLGDIEDSLYLMADGIERASSIVCQLAGDAKIALQAGKRGSSEDATLKRHSLVCDSSRLLPLVETQLDALRMTGGVLAEVVKQMREDHPIAIPGERGSR